jgi:hypothetical protein
MSRVGQASALLDVAAVRTEGRTTSARRVTRPPKRLVDEPDQERKVRPRGPRDTPVISRALCTFPVSTDSLLYSLHVAQDYLRPSLYVLLPSPPPPALLVLCV